MLCTLLCKCALYVDNYVVYAVVKVSLNYKKTKRGGKYMLTALNQCVSKEYLRYKVKYLGDAKLPNANSGVGALADYNR